MFPKSLYEQQIKKCKYEKYWKINYGGKSKPILENIILINLFNHSQEYGFNNYFGPILFNN